MFFKNNSLVKIPYQDPNSSSSWHLYILRLKLDHLTGTREDIFNALLKENIGVNVHYIPVYLLPYYRGLGYTPGLCPKAEKLYEEFITLPLFPAMKEKDVRDVIDAVEKVLNQYRKFKEVIL